MVIKILIGLAVGSAAGAIVGFVGTCNSGSCPLTSTPLRGALYGAVIATVLVLGLAGSGPGAPVEDGAVEKESAEKDKPSAGEEESEPAAESAGEVLEFDSAAEFDKEILQGKGLALVDMYATWCGPCRALAPVIESMAKTYAGKVRVAKVDVDELGEVAERYGVRSIPTVLVFKGGEVVDTLVGLRKESDYAAVLERF